MVALCVLGKWLLCPSMDTLHARGSEDGYVQVREAILRAWRWADILENNNREDLTGWPMLRPPF